VACSFGIFVSIVPVRSLALLRIRLWHCVLHEFCNSSGRCLFVYVVRSFVVTDSYLMCCCYWFVLTHSFVRCYWFVLLLLLNWLFSPEVGVGNPPSVTLQREGRHLGGSSTQSKRNNNNNNNVGLEHIVFSRGWGGELKVSAFHLKGWHLGVLCTHFVNWTDCFRPSWGELPPKCSTSAWSATLGG